MSKSSNSSLSFGVGLLFGVVAGALAGVLLAPKAGNETRKDLIDVAESVTSKNEKVKQYTTASTDIINKVRFTLEKQILYLNQAIKAGRMAAAKHKEEIETGYRY